MIETLKNKYIFLDHFNVSNKKIDCIIFDPITGIESGKMIIKDVRCITSRIDTCFYIDVKNQELLLLDTKSGEAVGRIIFNTEFNKIEDVLEVYSNE